MRLFAITVALFFAISGVARGEPLTFVALAKVNDRAAYEAFVQDVTPIWSRHGMAVVAALDVEAGAPFDHITILRVNTRKGFRAYIADPDYRALAPDRLAAVEALTILEGPLVRLPPVVKRPTPVSLIFQVTCAKDEPGARVSLIGHVKGTVPDFLAQTRCVRVVTADDIPTGTVLAGFSAMRLR